MLRWNGCGYDTVASNKKAFFAIASSQKYLASGTNYLKKKSWLEHLSGVPIDTSQVIYWNSFPDEGNGSTLSPILYNGFQDLYSPDQPGNWIRANNWINSLIVGETYFFGIDIHPEILYPTLDEAQIFKPNSSGLVPFVWDGVLTDHFLPPVAWTPPAGTQPNPVSVVTANNSSNTSPVSVNWSDPNTNSCITYKVTPVVMKGNTVKILTNISVTTSNKNYTYPYSVLHNANVLYGINGAAKYWFDVVAINGTLVSSPVRSTSSVNVK